MQVSPDLVGEGGGGYAYIRIMSFGKGERGHEVGVTIVRKGQEIPKVEKT